MNKARVEHLINVTKVWIARTEVNLDHADGSTYSRTAIAKALETLAMLEKELLTEAKTAHDHS